MTFKTVSGYVIAFGVLGFTGYAIYKHLKRKETGDVEISVEDARAEVERRRVIHRSYRIGLVDVRNAKMEESVEEFGDMMHDIRDTAGFNRSFMPQHPIGGVPGKYEDLETDQEEEEDTISFTVPMTTVTQGEEDEDDGDLFDEDIPDYTGEEGKELKHEPNSQEARRQFINMELADFGDGESYQMLLRLFDFPFNPVNDGDRELQAKIVDYRVRFFGVASKWTLDITFADVVLYYARAANFNYDETIKYWAEYFFQFNSMYPNMTSVELGDLIERLNDHSYYNDLTDTYGLFGLTSSGMDKAIKIAMRNVDNSVTYEIEFNEFLKSLS